MEREIKFRAWDGQQMLFTPTSTNYALHRFFGFIDNLEVMQFTGLKDKNGKEIYEGDIMKKTYGASIPLFEVSYHVERGLWIQNDGYNEPLCEVYRMCEVIGNIFETPELLNK